MSQVVDDERKTVESMWRRGYDVSQIAKLTGLRAPVVKSLLGDKGKRVSTGHYCHAVDCNIEVPPKLLMCRRHWFMVPKPIREAIWQHYRMGQEVDKRPSALYLQVMKQAVDAVAAKEGKV